MSRGLLSSLAANSVQLSASGKQEATSVPSPAAHPRSHPNREDISSSPTAKAFQPSSAHRKSQQSHPKTAAFSQFHAAHTLQTSASGHSVTTHSSLPLA